MSRLLLVSVLFLITSAHAQVESEKNQLGLLLGAELIADHTTAPVPQSAIGFGASETFQLNFAHRLKGSDTQLWLEFPAIAGPSHEVVSANTSTPVSLATFYATPSFRVNFKGERRVSPWLSFGGGYALYEGSELLRNSNVNPTRFVNTAALQFGGGIDARTKIKVLRPVGLRAEVRDFFSLEAPQFTTAIVEQRQHNVVVSGGFILRF